MLVAHTHTHTHTRIYSALNFFRRIPFATPTLKKYIKNNKEKEKMQSAGSRSKKEVKKIN